MVKSKKILLILSLITIIGTTCWYVARSPQETCTSIPEQTPEKGKHGWSMWQNESFKVFTPTQTPYCIEEGFEALGATVDEFSNVLFSEGNSGVIIKTDQFSDRTLTLQDDSTSIKVVYSIHLPQTEVDEYLKIIETTFKNVGSLYQNTNTQLDGHTVLITVGVAGDGSTVERSIYPTPSKDITILARNRNHPRSEELFIHAVTHLYNRHLTSNSEYQENQAPIPQSDWQELEASWAEIVFHSDSEARINRAQELYAIHSAVQSETFSSHLTFPFNSKPIYEEVRRKGVILGENPSYAEEEYSHYVLAPLLLVSIDGLLTQNNASTSVTNLIREARNNKNFFVLLQEHLSTDQMNLLNNFIFGREQIPYELIEIGLAQYQ